MEALYQAFGLGEVYPRSGGGNRSGVPAAYNQKPGRLYNCKKPVRGSMMRKLSWIFLLLLAVSLWAEESEKVENHASVVANPIAKQLDE